MKTLNVRLLRTFALFGTSIASAAWSFADAPLKPVIASEWWSVADNPDLGEFTGERQQPVDFGIWQAADGTWQIWSCIRSTKTPGAYTQRLLHGWEGKNITDRNWKPTGIRWVSKPELGETEGGMQAPYVMLEDEVYYLFYGDWKRICLATSRDGKNFTRLLGGNGQPDLFTEHSGQRPGVNTARDPMVVKRGNTYYCYYTSHTDDPERMGAAYVRVSLNKRDWSESVMVSRTPPYPSPDRVRFSDECPQVVYLPESELYYLFVTQDYGRDSQTTIYASSNPMYFGIDDDALEVAKLPIAAPEIVLYEGEYYIAALKPGLDGIQIAKLEWVSEN